MRQESAESANKPTLRAAVTFGSGTGRLMLTGWSVPSPVSVRVVLDGEVHEYPLTAFPRPDIARSKGLAEDAPLGFAVRLPGNRKPTQAVGIVVTCIDGRMAHASLVPLLDPEFLACVDQDGSANSVAGLPARFLGSTLLIRGNGNAVLVEPEAEMISLRLHIIGDRNFIRIGRKARLSGDILLHGDALSLRIGGQACLPAGGMILLEGPGAELDIAPGFRLPADRLSVPPQERRRIGPETAS